MYFPLSELHGWGKRPAARLKTIYSEAVAIPLSLCYAEAV